ncbi:TPA: hypothetical protein N0F65_008898 [Lagenidium giganteum]|uniref:DDE Tnp4 domain-containing protein n=1 Tax=Lagenidium giganteum TaxID=4803 RepID=A0AAV2YUG0_9STRA|nr:TPA: hypothetical protein N0F65_008898 [Lagenidium giganteum]
MSSGSCALYITSVSTAVHQHFSAVVCWPSGLERKAIADAIERACGIPSCVGLIDGTLLPLQFRPTLRGEDYFCRKSIDALNGLICCDHIARVTYVQVGYPGCTHDNRVWSESNLVQECNGYFLKKEFLIGDSAFATSSRMVSPFKNFRGGSLTPEQKFFNYRLSKIRFKTEHCIGLIKARFQYFKGIRSIIATQQDLRRILRLFKCAVIIHNLLVNEPIPEEIEHDAQDHGSDNDDAVNITTFTEQGKDARRMQVFHYLLEKDSPF